MPTLRVVIMGSSSANGYLLGAGEKPADLLQASMRAAWGAKNTVYTVAQNGTQLFSQTPTGYTIPDNPPGSGIASIPTTVNTSLNVTFALTTYRPHVLILYHAPWNMNAYVANGIQTTVSGLEGVIASEIKPAIDAIEAACIAKGCQFILRGGHSVTASGKSGQGFTDAEITGRRFADAYFQRTYRGRYIYMGYDEMLVSGTRDADGNLLTNYNSPSNEVAAASPDWFEDTTETHLNATGEAASHTNYFWPGFQRLVKPRRDALDVIPSA